MPRPRGYLGLLFDQKILPQQDISMAKGCGRSRFGHNHLVNMVNIGQKTINMGLNNTLQYAYPNISWKPFYTRHQILDAFSVTFSSQNNPIGAINKFNL